MPYPALTVANSFISLAQSEGRTLTNMQVQKLVFLAHGFHMAYPQFNGEPLVSESAMAWTWGPVFPPLYNKLKRFGNQSIQELIPGEAGKPPTTVSETSPAHSLIKAVWLAYGKFTGMQLSNMTHRQGTPWQKVWRLVPLGVIPNELIATYYKELISRDAQSTDVPASAAA
jgi:uncharacterized phage-associated protein